MRIGVVAKLDDERALTITKDIIEYCSSLGLDVFVEGRLSRVIQLGRVFNLSNADVDYVVVVGGDGTVLNVLQLLGDNNLPIIAVKSGKRAFLCEVPPEGFKEFFSKFVKGEFTIKEYMRLESIVGDLKLPYVLNEYVLTTSGMFRSKVTHFRVFKVVDGVKRLIYDILSDGIIIATSVGSTAYNLSVGGPLVDPDLDALIVTPLAPLSLCVRPVVLPSYVDVVVEVCSGSYSADVVADGNYVGRVESGGFIRVRKARKPARFVRFGDVGFDYEKVFQGPVYGF